MCACERALQQAWWFITNSYGFSSELIYLADHYVAYVLLVSLSSPGTSSGVSHLPPHLILGRSARHQL